MRAAIESAVVTALAECRRADLESFARGAGIERGIGWARRRMVEPYGVWSIAKLTDAALRSVAAAHVTDPAPVA